ncbi:carboxypeptidase-like regulatory domain-containing protein [Crocinitomix catalasitica]|nr:carboxypeptidase-like regulatory domain-containing protein [Crocinitomix catalasitica]
MTFFAGNSFSQAITGFVQDESNNPIPYAKVFVKNFPDYRAITDKEGKYYLGVDLNTYEVIYQCVGFDEQVVQVTVSKIQPTVQNVWMVQSNNELGTVEIKTKRRNIGWEITRRVIDHKREMVKQFDGYTCDIYIKGVETFDIKKKKKDLKDEENGRNEHEDKFEDSKKQLQNAINGENRMNMVEINMTKHFQYPNKQKEIRTAYEKIGKPDQIYHTTTINGEFNFYRSLIRMDNLHYTPIVSPLHPSGILSYKYKLKEIIPLENDTIYKIQIDARNVGTSTMNGHIWILKSEWVLTKVDVSMHKGNLKKYDDFRIIQEYEKLDSFWVVKSQIFEYKTKYGKETVKGSTVVYYSNYQINPTFPAKFFGNEVGITTEEAYERDSSFWGEIRPVPLSEQEQRTKFVQDSLTAIYTSDEYLDSVDAVFNKITALKVLFLGIEHRNRHKKTQWYLSSLADVYEPIGIGGMRAGPGFDIFKKWENEKWVDFNGDVTIGFNNADLRGSARMYHRYLPKKFGDVSVYYSRNASLINQWDAWLNMIHRDNYYMNNRLGVWNRMEIFNGFFASLGVNLERRSSFDPDFVFNHSLDSLIGNTDAPLQFDPYWAMRTNLRMQYTPGQQYMTEPKRKIILGSRWPTFFAEWEKGWKGPFGSTVDYDYIRLGIEQTFQLGTMGQSRYRITTGKFVNQDSVYYIDKKFFRQSDQTWFRWLFSQPMYSFQNLDSSYETQDFFVELHYIHHFNGAIVNKIPFMKKTGIRALMGGGFLYLPEHNNYFYTELFFGVERIFKVFKYRVRMGGYCILSVASNKFELPKAEQPKNIQFKLSFDIMNERNLKFNF